MRYYYPGDGVSLWFVLLHGALRNILGKREREEREGGVDMGGMGWIDKRDVKGDVQYVVSAWGSEMV